MTQPESNSMPEAQYVEFLKTMLAEVCDSDDPIFKNNNRADLEAECLSLGMSLPLVRVIPDVD